MNILSYIKAFSLSRTSWAMLLLFVVFFTGCAVVFQHVMNLAPCVMCIYERIAMLSIGGFAIIGLINPNSTILRWVGLAGWGASAYKGLMLSLEHVHYQTSIFATCEALDLPSWAPLNVWFPQFFEAPGDCSEIAWQFLTLSMPQWLVVIFASNLLAIGVIVLSQFAKAK